jgi:multimeric flavodoxin WrbA
MASVAIVYHSGYGHTAKLADAVKQGVESVAGAHAKLVSVDTIESHWDDLDKADALIFGAPTYMGSASAPFKAFMDASSKIWVQRGWKDKVAAGFTNSGSQSGDKLATLFQLMVFAMQHAMIWVGLDLLPGNNSSKGSPDDLNRIGSYIGAMAQSNTDQGPDVVPPASDLKTAEHLGARVAALAARMKE